MLAWRNLALAVAMTGALTATAHAQYGGYGGDDSSGGPGGYDDGRVGYNGAQQRGSTGGYDRDGRSQGGQGYGDRGQGYDGGRDYGDRGYGNRGGQRYGDPYRAGPRPGWGGGPGGQHWWRGRWWAPGVGACWRWSPWRQNWKWVCD